MKEEKNANKVNADGADVAFSVGVVGKSQEEARLPNTRVSNEQKLEQVIAVVDS